MTLPSTTTVLYSPARQPLVSSPLLSHKNKNKKHHATQNQHFPFSLSTHCFDQELDCFFDRFLCPLPFALPKPITTICLPTVRYPTYNSLCNLALAHSTHPPTRSKRKGSPAPTTPPVRCSKPRCFRVSVSAIHPRSRYPIRSSPVQSSPVLRSALPAALIFPPFQHACDNLKYFFLSAALFYLVLASHLRTFTPIHERTPSNYHERTSHVFATISPPNNLFQGASRPFNIKLLVSRACR